MMIRYKDLKAVSTKESEEPLLIIDEYLPNVISCYQNADMLPYTGNKLLLRKSCLDRLQVADKLLQAKLPSSQFLVVYGYRHPDVQKMYFLRQYQSLKQRNNNMPQEELLELVHQLIAVPDVAGHPTGGALDVTIQRNGVKLNMGTAIADFSNVEKIQTFSKMLTEEQKTNRLLLRSLMMQAGFAPYDGEWWHFSYGDKEWAYYYNKPYAIYDKIE